jgi:lysophospholipase
VALLFAINYVEGFLPNECLTKDTPMSCAINCEQTYIGNVTTSNYTAVGACPGSLSFFYERNIDCTGAKVATKVDDISSGEKDYVQQRISKVSRPAFQKFISNSGYSGPMPTVGFSFSGGGIRATIGAAGSTVGTKTDNPNAPLMQYLNDIAVYLVGLSGGAWFVGASFYQDLLVQNLIDVLITRMSGISGGIFNDYQSDCEYACKLWCDRYIGSQCLNFTVDPSFMVNWWGGGIANKFLLDQKGIENVFNTSLSDLRTFPSFLTHKYPFPIFTTSKAPVSFDPTGQSLAYHFEFTPYTVGSLNTDSIGYIDTKYFNTKFDAGAPPTGSCNGNGCCWKGDSLAFLLGISSAAFKFNRDYVVNYCEVYSGVDNKTCSDALGLIADLINGYCTSDTYVCGATVSNFLYNFGNTSPLRTSPTLLMTDGGFGGNVPITPLLSADRSVTDIFAFDNSADTALHFPTGEALVTAGGWAKLNNRPFPVIPDDIYTHISQNKILVFNGCRKGNGTNIPAVFYIPSRASPQNYSIPTRRAIGGADDSLYKVSNNSADLIGNHPEIQDLILCLWQNRYPEIGKPSSACSCDNDLIVCYDDAGQVLVDACGTASGPSPQPTGTTPQPTGTTPEPGHSGTIHQNKFSVILFILSMIVILFFGSNMI